MSIGVNKPQIDRLPEADRIALIFKNETEANAALKAVKTEADFREFQYRLAATSYYREVQIEGRRRGYEAFDFTPLPWNANKAHYLYNDGASTGRALWKNLWMALKVRMWPVNPSSVISKLEGVA